MTPASLCTIAWIVRLGSTGVPIVERYRLDKATMLYKHIGTFEGRVGRRSQRQQPNPFVIDWSELQF
ncbi:hypothetical protein [Planotetraspora sp. GP83]|uniref:hypothetical protein n=1 Tax=Planotetraspora sp. GP83 TaxID=3156264 RepID=UPI003518370D